MVHSCLGRLLCGSTWSCSSIAISQTPARTYYCDLTARQLLSQACGIFLCVCVNTYIKYQMFELLRSLGSETCKGGVKR